LIFVGVRFFRAQRGKPNTNGRKVPCCRRQAANLFILLVALHVALHWQWFVNLLRRSRGTPEGARHTITS
jgi:hypothetical protein